MCKDDVSKICYTIKNMPKGSFYSMCDYLGIVGEDLRILEIRFRESPSHTREYVAEEIGISPSTLDRRIKSILDRIYNYGNLFINNI